MQHKYWCILSIFFSIFESNLAYLQTTGKKICFTCAAKLTTSYNFMKSYEQMVRKQQKTRNLQKPRNESTAIDESIEEVNDDQNDDDIESPVNKSVRENDSELSRLFECAICKRQYKTKGYLKIHLSRHSRQKPRHQCRKCKQKFLTYTHFQRHQCAQNWQ